MLDGAGRLELAERLGLLLSPNGKCALNVALILIRLASYNIKIVSHFFRTLRRKVPLMEEQELEHELVRALATLDGVADTSAYQSTVEWLQHLETRNAHGGGGGDGVVRSTTMATIPRSGTAAAATGSYSSFSEAYIWQETADFYRRLGIKAFMKGPVPFAISSNRFVASAYVEMIAAWLDDRAAAGRKMPAQTEPLWIVELGSGHCQLAFHLAVLLKLSKPDLEFCMVMTDLTNTMFETSRAHPAFQSLLLEGKVDFAELDAGNCSDGSGSGGGRITLEHRGCTIATGGLVVAIGNYLFDSLPGKLYCSKREPAPAPAPAPGGTTPPSKRRAMEPNHEVVEVLCKKPSNNSEGIDGVSIEFAVAHRDEQKHIYESSSSSRMGSKMPSYMAAALDSLVEMHKQSDYSISGGGDGSGGGGGGGKTESGYSGHFLLPTAGIELMKHLATETKPTELLMIAGDKSAGPLDAWDNGRPPGLYRHGRPGPCSVAVCHRSLVTSVRAALQHQQQGTGSGAALTCNVDHNHTFFADQFNAAFDVSATHVNMGSTDGQDIKLTRLKKAHAEHVGSFGPAEFEGLWDFLESPPPGLTFDLRSLELFVRLSEHDYTVWQRLRWVVADRLREQTAAVMGGTAGVLVMWVEIAQHCFKNRFELSPHQQSSEYVPHVQWLYAVGAELTAMLQHANFATFPSHTGRALLLRLKCEKRAFGVVSSAAKKLSNQWVTSRATVVNAAAATATAAMSVDGGCGGARQSRIARRIQSICRM